MINHAGLLPQGANPPAERIVIVLRQSPDWAALAAGSAHDPTEFDRLIGRLPGSTADLISFWNAWSPVDFYRVRARLKAITLDNLARVGGARLTSFAAYGPPFDGAAIYVFTDDDDWFPPDLAQRLLKPGFTADGCVWTSVRFDGTILRRVNDSFCYTNNYAIHGSYLAGEHARAGYVCQHTGADEALRRDGVSRVTLDAPLSITNKHPCSRVTLERIKGEGREIDDYIALYREFLAAIPDDLEAQGIAWALPMMLEVSRFFAGLQRQTPPASGRET